jgi:hypothetical protein
MTCSIISVRAFESIVDYLIPKEVPYEFLNSIGITSVEHLPIEVVKGGIKLECYNNVQKYLMNNQGEIQFGWSYSQLGNIVLKLTGHVVVKRSDNSLLCVTPSEHDTNKIFFTPDNSVGSLISNNKLPAKIHALVDDEIVQKFVKLDQLHNQMRLDGNLIGIEYIMNEKHLISKRLINAFQKFS